MIPLDHDQLRTFVAISEMGSFTRAAEAVNKTQSAVSMQMRKLEERIGKDIFAREGRSVRLTDDGEKLLDYAQRIMRLNNEAIFALTQRSLNGHVRIGTPDDYADKFLPRILARFAEDNPLVDVTVICEPSPDLVDRIKRHELDLAIITHVETKDSSQAEVIRREPLLWVTSGVKAPHDGDPLPMALGRQNCAWREAAENALREANRKYHVRYSSWNSMAVSAAVAAGLAVSVLPESAVRPDMRVLGPADGFPSLPTTKIGLIRDRNRQTKLVKLFAEHIISSLDTQSAVAIDD